MTSVPGGMVANQRVSLMICPPPSRSSPCTRCGQDIEDYGFEAETLEIYPGDRIVAYEVTVLVRAAAVLTLPIMVLPIGPQDRLPRLEYLTGTATERARITLPAIKDLGFDEETKNGPKP